MYLPGFTGSRLHRAIKYRMRRWAVLPYESENNALPIVLGLVVGFFLTLWIFL